MISLRTPPYGPEPLVPVVQNSPAISVEVGRAGTTRGENGREEQARRPPSLNQSGAEQKCRRPRLYSMPGSRSRF